MNAFFLCYSPHYGYCNTKMVQLQIRENIQTLERQREKSFLGVSCREKPLLLTNLYNFFFLVLVTFWDKRATNYTTIYVILLTFCLFFLHFFWRVCASNLFIVFPYQVWDSNSKSYTRKINLGRRSQDKLTVDRDCNRPPTL